MGERYFGQLLERLDKAYPRTILEKDLLNENFSQNLLNMFLSEKLITRSKNKPYNYLLGPMGFLFLNQVRMKKIINSLNISLDKFNKSSTQLSKAIIFLTIVLILIAGIQSIIQLLF